MNDTAIKFLTRKSKRDKWIDVIDFNFNGINEYINNDEFVEYRKALADGKKISFLRVYLCPDKCTNCMDHSKWMEWNSFGQSFNSNIKYKIIK